MEKFSNFKSVGKKLNEQENVLKPRMLDVPDETVQKTDIAKFISKLFEAREMAHVFHLSVNGEMGSNAAHMALGEFYEEASCCSCGRCIAGGASSCTGFDFWNIRGSLFLSVT